MAQAAVADRRVKRAHENDLQWRSRVAAIDQQERDENEPLLTPEAESSGNYRDHTVVDEAGAIVRTKRNVRTSPLLRMHTQGQLTTGQLSSALQIAFVVERLTRSVGVSVGNLAGRVDNGGSARDPLIERMASVLMEQTYAAWRDRLPKPAGLIISMVTLNQPLVATARSYGIPWRKARNRLVEALDLWEYYYKRTADRLEDKHVLSVYRLLGEGTLLDA